MQKITLFEQNNISKEFFVYIPASGCELEDLAEKYNPLRILTNGLIVFAWDAEKANHNYVNEYLLKHPEHYHPDLVSLTIDGEYLVHSVQKHRETTKMFIKQWFKRSYYTENDLVYTKNGIHLKRILS